MTFSGSRALAHDPIFCTTAAKSPTMSGKTTNQDGFIEGYRAVKGNGAAVPAIPSQPATPAGKKPYQVGLQKGMEAAQR